MKKCYSVFTIILSPLMLFSCAKPAIDMPKSPFEDHYERIGMKSEFTVTNPMEQKDYNDIRNYVNNDNNRDIGVTRYTRQEESRDLKYAYFGQESSTISQCSMISHNEDVRRYDNNVTINNDVTDQQIQSANSGIIKTKTCLTDYIFDDGYKSSNLSHTYSHRLEKKNNDESGVVTESETKKTYSSDNEDLIFGVTPFVTRIKSHFFPSEIRTVPYEFKLLGPENKAIYGMSNDKYLIKEGYSIFPDFKTTMGRSYKAEDNFFYEGLLEKHNDTYRFTNFRFYHELLILSEAYDGTGVPILYLEKPVLIEYSEIKYQILYESVGTYTDNIPDITQQ